MSSEPGNLENDGDDVDPGEPIKILAGLESDTSSRLLVRVHEAINRRRTFVQVALFASHTPWVVLKELWSAVDQHLSPPQSRKDNSRETKTP